MRIAIQGVAGCFSAMAAARMAPGSILHECASFDDVFAALRDDTAERAIVPVENSLVGPIAAVQNLLAAQTVRILDEQLLLIEQCLILPQGSPLNSVRRVLSHPVALAQCSRFLASHGEWQPIPFFDTAGSVREIVRSGEIGVAAIAGTNAAAEYGATIVERGIGDREDNYTRFLLIALRA